MIRKKYKSLFVFDLETTGLSFKNDKIIEIGALYYKLNEKKNKYELESEHDYLINIGFKLPQEIIDLTHITDEMLEEGMLEEEMFSIVKKLIQDDTLIIGYNVQFDYSFLNELYIKYTNQPLQNDIVDVLAIYKDRYQYPHKLANAIERFNVSIPNSHRAIDDVKATFEVLRALIKENNDMHEYINIIGYNPKYPVSNKINQFRYVPQRGGCLEIKKSHL